MNQNIQTIDLPYRNPEVLEKLKEVSDRFNEGKGRKDRNQAHVCSFYVQGKCNRGAACPYRHHSITDDDLKSMQKGQGKFEDRFKNRYNGVSDPLAE